MAGSGPIRRTGKELWAENLPGSTRMARIGWERPERHSWVAQLDQAVAECREPPVLIRGFAPIPRQPFLGQTR
jgi:hypothetical protein